MDVKPPKRKRDQSKDQSAPQERKKKKKKLEDINPPEVSIDPPENLPKKRKRESTTNESKEKKKSKSKKEKKSKPVPDELKIDITAPAPPSKKALRLQKKGKSIPPLPSTSQPPSSTSDATHPDRKALVKEIPRAEFSVWIGNLSYKSDVKGLRGWLVRGDHRIRDKDITRMNLPLNADGQSKGYGLFLEGR
jgi:hypothetical protein